MKVLGIDPGSRFCGFGVVEDAGGTRVRHVAHGILEVGEAGAIEDRLCALHAGLSREILLHRPQMVAIELEPFDSRMSLTKRIAYGKSASDGSRLARARSASAPWPISRRPGPRTGFTSPTLNGGKL